MSSSRPSSPPGVFRALGLSLAAALLFGGAIYALVRGLEVLGGSAGSGARPLDCGSGIELTLELLHDY